MSTMEFSVPLSKEQKQAIYDSIDSDKEGKIYRLMDLIDSKYYLIFAGDTISSSEEEKASLAKYVDGLDVLTSRQKDFFKNLSRSAPESYIKSIINDFLKLLQVHGDALPEPTKQVEVPQATPEPEPELELEPSIPQHVPILL